MDHDPTPDDTTTTPTSGPRLPGHRRRFVPMVPVLLVSVVFWLAVAWLGRACGVA